MVEEVLCKRTVALAFRGFLDGIFSVASCIFVSLRKSDDEW